MSEVRLPEGAPKEGEVFRHYKGNLYKVRALALHSNDDEWMVLYEPLYEGAVAPLFTRPLREWGEEMEWQGARVVRFTKVAQGVS